MLIKYNNLHLYCSTTKSNNKDFLNIIISDLFFFCILIKLNNLNKINDKHKRILKGKLKG